MMGFYVHLHVCFACDRNDGVAALARKHLHRVVSAEDYWNKEVVWFLTDLSERTGPNPGPKGGLSMWGMVGNYSSGETFCEALRPFWQELLAGVDGGPNQFEHILVFEETEQRERAIAFEISAESGVVTIQRHECPFAWMQM
jgi:hypothetical protein